MRILRDALGNKEFQFCNGLRTAEVPQQAYRSIGVTLYSSATLAFAPTSCWRFIPAGVWFSGINAGPVRAPLIDISEADRSVLRRILDNGRKVLAQN